MNVKQKAVSTFIIFYLCILLGSVYFKIDAFPFTWGPMFLAAATDKTSYLIAKSDQNEAQLGIEVEHRDGSWSRVKYTDLNIPFRMGTIDDGFSVIYSLIGSLCDLENENFAVFPTLIQRNRRERGPRIIRQLIRSFNRSLGRKKKHPKFIVNLAVQRKIYRFKNLESRPEYELFQPLSTVSCRRLLDESRM